MMIKQPNWLKNAVFYEIYPQSFNDTNGDGIGDIQGIIKKLDYICDMGFNAIWLNPCFESPFNDAGYDVSDYYNVAPRYGTNADLKNLFDACHERDIHILLDLVPGHTSVEHKWFKKSMKADENEYTNRYIWTDSVWAAPKDLPTIRGFSERNGCCVVNFFSIQPALNYGFGEVDPDQKWQQPVDAEGPISTVNELINIMRFWLNLGCDGFRVDMAGQLVKKDKDQKYTIKLWQKIRAFLNEEFPNSAMVSEWGEPEKSFEGGFNMDFLLHFGPSHYLDLFRTETPYFAGNGNIAPFVEKYKELCAKTNKKGYICIPSGNHDMLRISHKIKGEKLKIAFAFLLSMPGAPFVYYGDEIGMKYLDDIKSVEGGYTRTGSRTPMQWDSTKNAGFSTAPKEKLYIRQDETAERPTVEEQLQDPNSLLSEIKRMISIRKENAALSNDTEIEFINVGYPLIYNRYCDKQKITVLLNPSDKDCKIENVAGKVLYKIGEGIIKNNNKTVLKARSALFIEC